MDAVEAHCTTHKNMIAADFRYHHSFMSRFMLSKLPSDVEGNQNYDSAFVDLVTSSIFHDTSTRFSMVLLIIVQTDYRNSCTVILVNVG